MSDTRFHRNQFVEVLACDDPKPVGKVGIIKAAVGRDSYYVEVNIAPEGHTPVKRTYNIKTINLQAADFDTTPAKS